MQRPSELGAMDPLSPGEADRPLRLRYMHLRQPIPVARPECALKSRSEGHSQLANHRAYARTSIIDTVALFCSRAINSSRNAVAGFPSGTMLWQPA